jgi:YD repeat-containing protein
LPILIEKKDVALFKYDNRGRVVEKETNDTLDKLDYNDAGKVTSIRRVDALEPSVILFAAEYQYDQSNRLIGVHTSNDQHFSLS